jgi:hypothetical protein
MAALSTSFDNRVLEMPRASAVQFLLFAQRAAPAGATK